VLGQTLYQLSKIHCRQYVSNNFLKAHRKIPRSLADEDFRAPASASCASAGMRGDGRAAGARVSCLGGSHLDRSLHADLLTPGSHKPRENSPKVLLASSANSVATNFPMIFANFAVSEAAENGFAKI
jgi:hypothetical protein